MIKKDIRVLLVIMLMVIVPSTPFICLAQNDIPPRQEIIDLTNEEQKIQTERVEEKLKNTNTSKCNWIKLNTNFPGIWNCIETSKDAKTNPTNAFPTMIWTLTRIVISLVLVACFILIIVGWIMRAADEPKKWKDLITKVAITILLLWFSWVILRLINPNFFG